LEIPFVSEPALNHHGVSGHSAHQRGWTIPVKCGPGITPVKLQLSAYAANHFHVPRRAEVALNHRHALRVTRTKRYRSAPGHEWVVVVTPEMDQSTRRRGFEQFEIAFAPKAALNQRRIRLYGRESLQPRQYTPMIGLRPV